VKSRGLYLGISFGQNFDQGEWDYLGNLLLSYELFG
jgi:hypothetical protein